MSLAPFPSVDSCKLHLTTLPLADALWWFIENQPEDTADRNELFFYLRERYRNERQGST